MRSPDRDTQWDNMANKMLKFVDVSQQMPEKRAADNGEKVQEIYNGYNPDAAVEQASRCSQCGCRFTRSTAGTQQHPGLADADRRRTP